MTECCLELGACVFDTACLGEARCVTTCVRDAVAEGGVPDDEKIGYCASQCAVGATVTAATNDFLACIYSGARADGSSGTDCLYECAW
jgi:hypothetical protein